MIMIIFLLEIRTYKKGSGRMNYETYIKDIKRLNQRIVQVAKSFGKESPLYMEYENKLSRIFPKEQINVNRRGELQLSRSKKYFNPTSHEYVQRVQKSTKTVAEVRKQARQSLRSDIPKGTKITNEMIQQRIRDRWEVERNLQGALDLLYGREDELAQNVIDRMKQKGNKSYAMLTSVISESKNTDISIKNMFEGL